MESIRRPGDGLNSPRLGIAAVRSTLKDYLYEAIELEESGTKIDLKKPEYPIPESCRGGWTTTRFSSRHSQRSHQAGGKSYIFHVSSAKQAKPEQRGRKSACQ